MKNITFLLLIVILASCGSLSTGFNHVKLVKTEKSEQVVLENEHAKERESTAQNQFLHIQSSTEEKTLAQLEPKKAEEIGAPLLSSKFEIPKISTEPDSTANNDDSDEIISQAIQTEKMAGKSMGFLIASFLTSWIPILGLVLFILGVVNYFKARKERYITEKGQTYLLISTIILIVNAILIALALLLIIAIIAFLL
jgi:flagellar motor component MotA